jgi:hypothetical protein
MAEDEPGARSVQTAEVDQNTEDAITHQADGGPTRGRWQAWIPSHWRLIRRWMASNWRLIMFLVILILAAATGFHYKSLATPGAEPARFRSQPSQFLIVYFPDASDAVKATVAIFLAPWNAPHPNPQFLLKSQGYTYFGDAVHVTVTYAHPVSQRQIIMASATRPVYQVLLGSLSHGLKTNFVRGKEIPFMAAVPLIPNGPPNSHGQETYTANQTFQAIPAVFESNGSVYGHLPFVIFFQDYRGHGSTVHAEFAARTGKLLRADIDNGQLPQCRPNGSPEHGNGIPHPADCERFTVLKRLPGYSYYATEYLRNAALTLNTDQIDYMNPSATAGPSDYAWRSDACCDLEPIFKLSDPTATDSQNQAAFTSGIAFGVAGAALLAALAELPKEFPWPRRKRLSKTVQQDA